MSELEAAVAYLRSPLAIRARCENVLEAGIDGRLAHFAIDLDALPRAVDEVVAVIRARHPDLAIPTHGAINDFRAGGIERVEFLDGRLAGLPPEEQARVWVDLIVVSAILDPIASDTWRYREEGTNLQLDQREGVAVASFHAFEAGLFSEDAKRPLRVDANGLHALSSEAFARAFQIANPPIAIVRSLAHAIATAPTIFIGGRAGGLVDNLLARAATGRIEALTILRAMFEGLAATWPVRETLGGANLGDVWRHPAAGGTGPSQGLVPFHEQTQRLAYAMFEPLARAGVTITQPGALTPLPDARNGGLLVDLGVVVPKHPNVRGVVHAIADEVIVEWRALTVALIDRAAEGVRAKLGKSPGELPLANILEGTSATGRAVAERLRTDRSPPIRFGSWC
jgi:hypothetical protein